jgi:hypothetical protein
VGVDEMLPEWQLSDGELSAALFASKPHCAGKYGRMPALVGETDKRGVAVAVPSRFVTAAAPGPADGPKW